MKARTLAALLLGLAAPLWAAGDVVRLDAKWARDVSPTRSLGLGVFSLGFPNSTCTATLVSRQGHLLTARHCLENAVGTADSDLRRARKPARFSREEVVVKDVMTVDRWAADDIAGSLQVPVGLDDETVYAHVSAVGKGVLWPRFSGRVKDPELRERHMALTDEGFSVGGDFAVVRIEELAGQACYRFAPAALPVGARARSVGFPCSKKPGLPWPEYRDAVVLLSTGERGESYGRGTNTYVPAGSFVTDGAVEECHSGTAIMDADKNVAGVLHTIFKDPERGLRSIVLSVPRMLELMAPRARAELLALNAECGRR